MAAIPPLGSEVGRSRPRRADFGAAAAAILLTTAAYLWTLHAASPTIATRQPMGIYPLQTDALLSGHLHFKQEPDPRLVRLANPYAGNQGIPRIHDATLFRGHYYSYFGVTPVLLLMAPWRLLTGTFLTEGAASIVFAYAGFLIAAALWIAAKRRFFPELSAAWLGFGILMLGLGDYVFVLIQTAQVWELPISCACACLTASIGFVAWAAAADAARRRTAGIGLASLAWALAIGARPDTLPSLAAFGMVVFALWRRTARETGSGPAWAFRLLVSAALPLICVGASLAAYNWARFGSPFEAGIHYQLLNVDQRHVKLMRLRYAPAGLRGYLLPAPAYSPYFPFLAQTSMAFGVPAWAPFALVALGYPWTLRDSRLGRDPAWVLTGGAALLAALANFATLCCFWGGAVDRYEINFLPMAIGVGLVVASKVLADARRRPRLRPAALVLCAAAAWTLGHCVLLGVGRQAESLRGLARLLDEPAYGVERALGIRQGPVEMRVVLPKARPGVDEPLVATGGGRDVVYLRRPDATHIRIGFFHEGAGGLVSPPIAIDAGRPHELQVDLGSLYPPPEHPAFARWPKSLLEALHRRVLVRLDGRTVLQASSAFYPNDPLHTSLGRNPRAANGSPVRFTGRILARSRGGIPRPSQVAPIWAGGPVKLKLVFPSYRYSYGEPLVSTGPRGKGDLVYVTYLGPGRIRFGHDSLGYGPAETAQVRCDPDSPHEVEIDMGSLHAPGGGEGRFQVRFDGTLLVSAPRPFHPSAAVDVAFGFDACGSSAAAPSFSGPRFDIAPLEAFAPPAPPHPAAPARLLVRFSARSQGAREPLLVTGRNGAGDAIFIAFLGGSRVRLGHDHWGVGEVLGPPLDLDLDEPHEILLRFSPRLSATIDGAPALDSPLSPYPAQPGECYLGKNPIGASTCEAAFSGQILLAEALPDPAFRAPAGPVSSARGSGR